MKKAIRIIITLVVIILTLYLSSFLIDCASTSSGMSVEERRSALNWLFIVLAVGLLSVIAIWLPWKKWLNKE